MQARADTRRRAALRQTPVRFCTARSCARLLPFSWRMSDPTLDSRASPSPGRRAIVVLLVDDQAFVGAALSLLLESEPDIEVHSCLSAVNAIARACLQAQTEIVACAQRC